MTTTERSLDTTSERTQVLRGGENVVNAVLQFVAKTNSRIDACVDHTRPLLIIEIEQLKKAFLNAKSRGVRLRYVTEVTKDNIPYCKELMTIVDELYHLEGIKGNFYISETEYIAPASLHEKGKPASQIIYSNVKEIVEHQQYVFDSFWNKAIPAEQRIREIEEGLEREFFEVITDHQKASQILVDLAKSAKKEALVILPNDRSMTRVNRLGIIDYLIKASQNGAAIKVICPLTEENSEIVKEISERAPDIRIVNGNNCPVGIVIVDNAKFFRAELREPKAEEFPEAIGFAVYSNSRPSVESFRSVFELLWNERVLNEELKRADKIQKEFINVASHEMKTPTQAILGYAELIQSHPEKREEMVQAIYRNAVRLQKLTNDILDVTRIESRSLKLNKEQFNLNDLISSVVEDYKNHIEKENDNVKLFYDPKNDVGGVVALVEADKGRITQVISNLLGNAIKFTKHAGVGDIYISAYTNDNHQVIVSVKDTGTGIDPEIMPRLFTKFATKSQTGTGLGLFISKSIIEAHGGKIWAENNSVDGSGATFHFSLPLKL